MTDYTGSALVLVLLMVPLLSCATRAAVQPNPYTADQVERLLRGGIDAGKILADAQRECISFRITPEIGAALRQAGATDEFVLRLGAVCYHAPAASAR